MLISVKIVTKNNTKKGPSNTLPAKLKSLDSNSSHSSQAEFLRKGDNKPSDINECILPLEKGESRVAAGGHSARLFVQSLPGLRSFTSSSQDLRTIRASLMA